MCPLEDALTTFHKPEKRLTLKNAIFRLKILRNFFLSTEYFSAKTKPGEQIQDSGSKNVGYNFKTFYKNYLPFELTNAQKKVMKEIRAT